MGDSKIFTCFESRQPVMAVILRSNWAIRRDANIANTDECLRCRPQKLRIHLENVNDTTFQFRFAWDFCWWLDRRFKQNNTSNSLPLPKFACVAIRSVVPMRLFYQHIALTIAPTTNSERIVNRPYKTIAPATAHSTNKVTTLNFVLPGLSASIGNCLEDFSYGFTSVHGCFDCANPN